MPCHSPGEALERLLASMGVAVNAKGARPAECFVASLADVAILRLRESSLSTGRDVVMVLPRVRTV